MYGQCAEQSGRCWHELHRTPRQASFCSSRRLHSARVSQRPADQSACDYRAVHRSETGRALSGSYHPYCLGSYQATDGQGLHSVDCHTNEGLASQREIHRGLFRTQYGASFAHDRANPYRRNLCGFLSRSTANKRHRLLTYQHDSRIPLSLLRGYTSSQWPPQQVARASGRLQRRGGFSVPLIIPHHKAGIDE
jgi:hypothetical protein